jgi:radical SAM protein with 4Fe4S-binding SPASM domain
MKAPITVQLEVTEQCNYKCPHCYHLDNESNEQFWGEKADESCIKKIAKKLAELKIFSIILTGGEPLINKELVLDLLDYFDSKDISVAINTNLSLLTEEFLSNKRLNSLRNFLVSCPSCDKELYKIMTGNGDYSNFEKKLLLLIKSSYPFSVNMVVNKRNLHDIRNTAKRLKSLGVKKFGATPMALNLLSPDLDNFLELEEVKKLVEDLVWVQDNLGLKVDIFEALPTCLFSEKILNRNFGFIHRKCQAGVTSLAISSNGDVRPCTHNIENYGNILKDDFTTIWESMQNWRNRSYLPERCNFCKSLSSCEGGCRMTAKAFSASKDLKSEDPWMTNPLEFDIKKNKQQKKFRIKKFSPQTIISIDGKIQSRKEDDDSYLVAIKGRNNATRISNEFFSLVKCLQKKKKYALIKLAKNDDVFNSESFQNVIKILFKRRFINFNNKV